MLLRDGEQFKLTKQQIEKFSKDQTYTVLEAQWLRGPNGPDGKPVWTTKKTMIPLTSKFIFEDGNEGMLTYCESLVPATTNKPMLLKPIVHDGLVKGAFFVVKKGNADLIYYLENCGWNIANSANYGLSPVFMEANAKQVARKEIEEENITTDARLRITRELSEGQLIVIKQSILNAGVFNRFREDMDKDELIYELVSYLGHKQTREIVLNAMAELDSSFNHKVDKAIESEVLIYNITKREWQLNEGGRFRALVKVSQSQNKQNVIMGYFNNSPEEQRLLTKLIEATPATV